MNTMRTTLLLLCGTALAIAAYPELKLSFRAKGSIYFSEEGVTGSQQIAFEENFDLGTQKSALTTIVAGINSTVIEYLTERRAFIFDSDNECRNFRSKDAAFETDIRVVKTDGNGQYVLPIHQLLTLDKSYLVKQEAEIVLGEGNVKIQRWSFFINESDATLDIKADWSSPETTTASAFHVVPLRFEITRKVKVPTIQTIHQVVKVDLFTHGQFNRKVFWPRRGVYCPDMKEPFAFPEKVVKKLQVLRTKVEQVVKDFSSVGVVDTWFDPKNELYKINFSPIKQMVKNGVQRIISHVQGVVYDISETRKCIVKEVKQEKDNFDPETIFNPMNKKDFSMEGFFGIGKVQYNSLGQTMDRGIPCNLYQGLRNDWPPEETKGRIQTIWEWCLADQQVANEVQFQLNGFPLVSLNIYVKESPYSKEVSFYYKGLQLEYNFYDVRNNSNRYLDNLAFDIRQCFEDNNQKRLEFRALVHEAKVKALLELNERHQEHVAAWTDAIVKAAKIRAASLRVASVQTRVDEQGLEVSFFLLGRHPDLPAEVEEIPLDEAMANVQTTLDDGKLSVSVNLGSEAEPQAVSLKGEPGTLKSKIVEDETEKKKTSGISAVTMAAVAVVMLALGVAIGAAFIFSKKRRMYQRV